MNKEDLLYEIEKALDDAEDLREINNEILAIRRLASIIETLGDQGLLDSEGRLLNDYLAGRAVDCLYRGENPVMVLKNRYRHFAEWLLGKKVVAMVDSLDEYQQRLPKTRT